MFSYLILGFWSFVVIFPFYWLLVTAFKLPVDVSSGPKYIPFVDYQPTGQHWQTLFTGVQGDTTIRHFRNSLIVSTGSTFLAVVVGAMGGYALSRFQYYWRWLGWRNNNIAYWIISQRFLPPALFVVPFLMGYAALNLIDTHVGLILIYTMINIPFAVWIMRDFFDTLPIDLEESARVDGASRWQAFVRIVFPLSTPGLVSVAVFSFVFSWNEFLFALMLTNFKAITLPVLIAGQNSTRGIEWWSISALTLVAAVPVIIMSLFLQRFITRGLVAGAIKG
ncbi:MAG: carbohydrate ABC transporter permease [Burkholderiales bacterium]|nr:carbohydrate ABC transporter permease [Anaerolineae bacterium]